LKLQPVLIDELLAKEQVEFTPRVRNKKEPQRS